MKVVNTGNRYEIYGDSLRTYDSLPVQVYTVRFSKSIGFFLDLYSDIAIKEEKVYGVHEEKVDKVLKAFGVFERNLGVILSGAKGIGKSLFAKMLAVKAVSEGLPVLIVDTYIPGIASYIEEINQEVMVLFDEFDKTFGGIKAPDGAADPQTELLTLFDGLSQGKKLFVITCNETRHLSDYLINRPGRFHYHFRFEYPTAVEIREYLRDKLNEEYYGEIEAVVAFASKVEINYDCLRAIAFEINLGNEFKDAIKELNIVNMYSVGYIFKCHMSDGSIVKDENYIDLFGEKECTLWIDNDEDFNMKIDFNIADIQLSPMADSMIIPGTSVKTTFDYTRNCPENKKNLTLKYIEFTRKRDKRLHYAV